jgi:FkbM family methyltransferase
MYHSLQIERNIMNNFSSEVEDASNRDAVAEQDVYYCYRLILDREPDPDGWATYTSAIRNGLSLQGLVNSFLNSTEFRNRQLAREDARSKPLLVDTGLFKIYLADLDSPVSQCIARTLQYEPHVTAAIRRFLRPGMVFVDVGANFGYLSLVAAREVGGAGRVHSFEPNPYFCKLLYLSVKANGFDNVEIYPVAVADRKKNLIYDDTGGNGRISEFDVNLESTPDRLVVRAWTLDDLLRDEASIDLVKMDVEGAEHLVILGAKNILKTSRPVIISEFSPAGLRNVSGVSGEEFLRQFVAQGYNLSVLETDGRTLEYGSNIESVLSHLAGLNTSLLDLVATPEGRS